MSGRGRPRGSGGGRSGNNGGKWNQKGGTSSRGSSPSPRNSTSNASGGRNSKSNSLSPTRGRGQRGRPPKPHLRTLSASPVKRKLDLDGDTESQPHQTRQERKLSRKHRRPKFQDNPSAPEIVEKGALKTANMEDGDCDTSGGSSIIASNGHDVEGINDDNSLEANGGLSQSPKGRKRVHQSEGDENSDDADSEKKPKLEEEEEEESLASESQVTEAVSGLVQDMVSEIDDDEESALLNEGHDDTDTPTLSNGLNLPEYSEELQKQFKDTLSESLNMAVKQGKDDYSKTVDNLKEFLRDQLRETWSKCKSEETDVLCPAKLVTESRTILTEFLENSDCQELLEDSEKENNSMQKDQLIDQVVSEVLKTVQTTDLAGDELKAESIEITDDIPIVMEGDDASEVLQEDTDSKTANDVTGIIPFHALDKNMVPVNEGEASIIIEQQQESPKQLLSPNSRAKFDKSKLFSQMEDKFAKDTQWALKNKPVYRRRTNAHSESELVIKADKEEEDASKIVAVTEPGEVRQEQWKSDGASDNKDSSTCPESYETLDVNAAQGTTQVGSSELTKSLRKVRVRRSRTVSSSDPNSTDASFSQPPPLSSAVLSNPPQPSSANLEPPTLEAEIDTFNSPPPRVIRPRLVLSPKQHNLSDEKEETSSNHMSSKVSEPLKIVIPSERSRNNAMMPLIGSKSQQLLMTPTCRQFGKRVGIGPTVLTPLDANSIALAVNSCRLLVPPKLKVNGQDMQASSITPTNAHAPLKTVIRVPKPGGNKKKGSGGKKRIEIEDDSPGDEDQEATSDKRKRKRIFSENSMVNARSSISPVDRMVAVVDGDTDENMDVVGDGLRTKTPDSQSAESSALAE